MITYVMYSEAGGVGKTTSSVLCAAAHAEQGFRTLVIDQDPQDASLSYLMGVDDNRSDQTADNLVRHVLGRPEGDFYDLIEETDEGFDVIPTHDMWESFEDLLSQREAYEEQMATEDDYEFPRYEQLQRVLAENDVADTYDVVLIDPQASPGPALYNAIYAMRNLVMPVEATGKGSKSIDGISSMVDALEQATGKEVGVVAITPTGIKRTNTHQNYVDKLHASDYDVPVVVGERAALMDDMWDAHATAFRIVEEDIKVDNSGDEVVATPGERRTPDREKETIEKYRELAGFIADAFGVEPPAIQAEVV